ncbi:hypothetical protein ASPCAL00649 [Aspergillus calidoustus]|uniref:Uncharacterized protein n=1 Tax=Aspergillus calidoustus TaxID=454130 RepID=A0A0U5FNH0_ASPCI|nr:hypothetical protein ASPCAL00649 [Aspergillus calidoustus]
MEIADTIFRQGHTVSERKTGFINVANLLPCVGQDADEFYRIARELSQWDMQARLAIRDRINAGTMSAEQEARFNNWRKESWLLACARRTSTA